MEHIQTPYDTSPVSLPGFDPTPYRRYLDDVEIDPKDADELIHTLHGIMKAFVDCGFRLDPVQCLLDEIEDELSAPSNPEVGFEENRTIN